MVMMVPPPKSANAIRVVSYNIRKCVGLDMRRDPHRIAGVIRQIGADIVALQEADKRLPPRRYALPPDVIRSETNMFPAAVAPTKVSLGFHGNALLLAPGWQVDAVHRLPLPGLEPRGAIIVDVTSARGPLRVMATHLGLRRRDRQQQMTLMMAEQMSLAARPTILLGDLNEWSPSQGFAPLDPFFTVHNPGRSFPSRRPIAALDRVATGPGLHLLDAGAIRAGAAGHASDHLPIWADLGLAD